MTQIAPAVSGGSLSIFCAPDTREVVDLPRIYIFIMTLGSQVWTRRPRLRRAVVLQGDGREMMEAMHRGSGAW